MASSSKEVRLEELMPLIRESLAQGQRVGFSPRGVSMLPMLRQGLDTVELSPAPDRLAKHDLPLYRRDNGQYVLHRIVKVGEHYTCCGDNQFDLEYPVRRDQVIALVTAFTRAGKRVEVTGFGYRLYCRLWCGTRPLRRCCRRGRGWLARRLKP